MFKVVKQYAFKAVVTVRVPNEHGKYSVQTFTAHFQVLPQAELNELFAKNSTVDVPLLKRVLTGWEPDLVDENGEPLPFSEETRDAIINIPFARAGLVDTYFERTSNGSYQAKN